MISPEEKARKKQEQWDLIKWAYERTRKCVVTGPAAAVLLGIETLDWVEQVDLRRESGTNAGPRASARPGVIFRSGHLDEDEVMTTDGIRHVNGIRLLSDTFKYYGRLAALVSIESARNKWPSLTVEELLRRADHLPKSNGYKAFQELLRYSSGTSQSVLETLGRDALLAAELSEVHSIEYQVEVEFCDRTGWWRRSYLDMLINGVIGVEFDGLGKTSGEFGDPSVARAKERAREIGIQNEGFQILRVSWSDVVGGRFPDMVRRAILAREQGPKRLSIRDCRSD